MWCAFSIKVAARDFSFLSNCLCLQTLLPSSLLLPTLYHHHASLQALTSPLAMAGDGMWHPCNITKAALDAHVKGGLLRPVTDKRMPEWIVPLVNDREPNPPPGYLVCFLSFLDRGFGILACRFMRALVHYYDVELHNFNLNSIMQAAVFATVCEGYRGSPTHLYFWLHLFKAEMSSHNEGGEKRPLRAGACTLQLLQSRSGSYI